MSRYIETLVGKKDVVLIEVEEQSIAPLDTIDVLKASPSKATITAKAKDAFNQVMAMTRSIAKEFSLNLRKATNPPNEVSLEFGIKVDAEAGTLIAKTGAEANFTVKLLWKKSKREINSKDLSAK